jgi:hypothetical protein
MHLTNTLPAEVYASLTSEAAPCSRYTASVSGHICVGDFMCMPAARKLKGDVGHDGPGCLVMSQMLKQFCAVEMCGQIARIYDAVEEEKPHVEFGMDVYMQCNKLPDSLGTFSSGVPEEKMLVQTDSSMVGCLLEEIDGAAMVIHMPSHATLMDGLLHVYFIASLYEPIKQCLLLKSRELHIRSSSDLHRKKHHRYVSVP